MSLVPFKAKSERKLAPLSARTGKFVNEFKSSPNVKFRPNPNFARPRKGIVRKTGVKGKNLAATAYQGMLKSKSHTGSGLRRRTVQRFSNSRGTAMVGHDLVGTFEILSTAAQADLVLSLNINPVALGFPALEIESGQNQQYIFETFAIHLPNESSDFVNGDMLGWFDRDPDEVLPAGIEGIQIGYYKGGRTGAFKDGMSWHMPRFPGVPVLYCRDISSDERLVNQCAFNLQILTPPSVYNSGAASQVALNIEVWASYHCQFLIPDISQALAQAPGLVAIDLNTVSTAPTAADPFAFANTNWAADPDLSDPLSIPGFFWTNQAGGGSTFGMFPGFGLDGTAGLDVAISHTATAVSANLVSTVVGQNATLVATRVANAVSGNLTRNYTTFNVQVTNPGLESDTLNQASVVNYIESDGTISTRTGAPDDPILWSIQINATSPTFTTVTTVYFQAHIVSFTNANELALRCAGVATLQGLCKRKFREMTNEQRAKYKGRLCDFVADVRKKLHPPPPPFELPTLSELLHSEEKKGDSDPDNLHDIEDLGNYLPRNLLKSEPPSPTPSRTGDEVKKGSTKSSAGRR